jgi:hypothetical protein
LGVSDALMKKLVALLLWLAGGVCALVLLGFGIGSSIGMPDHAVVIVDADRKLYLAPPCVSEGMRYFPRLTIAQARKLGFQPEPSCRDQEGFVQEARSLSGIWFERLGLLNPLPSRWNADGTWNW